LNLSYTHRKEDMLSQRISYTYAFIIVLLCFTVGCIVTLFFIFCLFANKKSSRIVNHKSPIESEQQQPKKKNSINNYSYSNQLEQSNANDNNNKVKIFELKEKPPIDDSKSKISYERTQNEQNIETINEIEPANRRLTLDHITRDHKRGDGEEKSIEPIDAAGDSILVLAENSLITNSNNELNKLDFAHIKSKYRSGISQNPRFKNYLHKSKRPFIGYESNSTDILADQIDQSIFSNRSSPRKHLAFEAKLKSK
jgi:hypothetical protein